MRTVCAWCGAVIQEGEEPTTHGICPSCEAAERKVDPLQLRQEETMTSLMFRRRLP